MSNNKEPTTIEFENGSKITVIESTSSIRGNSRYYELEVDE